MKLNIVFDQTEELTGKKVKRSLTFNNLNGNPTDDKIKSFVHAVMRFMNNVDDYRIYKIQTVEVI